MSHRTLAQVRLARVIPSMHVHLCVVLWLFLFTRLLFLFVPLLFFQPFQMSSSEFHERLRSNPLCDFRLGTVATSDHETPLTPTSYGRSSSQHTPQDITPTLACMQERSTPIATVHEAPSPSPVVGCALVTSGVQKLSTNRCEVGSVKPVQNEPMNAAPRQQAQKKTMGGHSVATVPFQKSMMGSSHHSAKKSLMGSSQTHCRTSQQWSDGELL